MIGLLATLPNEHYDEPFAERLIDRLNVRIWDSCLNGITLENLNVRPIDETALIRRIREPQSTKQVYILWCDLERVPSLKEELQDKLDFAVDDEEDPKVLSELDEHY